MFNLIEWINGKTKLNKDTLDTFQNNIAEAFDVTLEIEEEEEIDE